MEKNNIRPHNTPMLLGDAYLRGKYQMPEHIVYLNNKLIDVALGKIDRLLITMPPQHGKSWLASWLFPSWYLLNFPEKEIILASYETGVASRWLIKTKQLLDDMGGYEFSIERAVNFIIKNHNGGMFAAGVGGAITGRSANLVIIDDPIKNPEEAHSETYRNKIDEWRKAVAETRLAPDGAIIVIQTRWHEDDLAGRLLPSGEYEHVHFPALAVENDVLGRKEGEALWAKRYDKNFLLRKKKSLGNYYWNTLYQNEPIRPEGALLKTNHFRFYSKENGSYSMLNAQNETYKSAQNFKSIFATVDLAASQKTTADYTVALVAGVTYDNELLILDVVRERMEGSKHIDLLNYLFHKWNLDQIYIEAVQYQLSLVQNAIDNGLPAIEVKADKDKVSRALPAATLLEAGKIYLPRHAEWLNDFIYELNAFPHGKHDDQTDAFAYAVRVRNEDANKQLNIRTF